MQEMIRKICPSRPTYGTRRMAAQVSSELNRLVNHKAVRRIFRRLGWSAPSRTKREIIRANKKPPRPNAPNRFWESDMSHIWHGVDVWGYCFNVIDGFTRQWLAFVLASRATCRHAIMAVNNAVAAANPALPGLTVRAGNGHRYTSHEFRSVGCAGNRHEVHLCQHAGAERAHRILPQDTQEHVWPRGFADNREAKRRCGPHSTTTTTPGYTLPWNT